MSAISKTPNCYAWRQTTASVSHSTKRAFIALLSKSCWDLLQPSTSAIPSKYTKAQIRNFVVPDYGFAFLRTWGRSSSDDAEDRDAVRQACWKDFECVGYGQKSDRNWDLLKYGDTKTNTVYTKGIWRKYVSPAPGYKLVTTSNNADGYDTLEEALDAKCQADWKCLGFDFSFKFSNGRSHRQIETPLPR